MSLKRKRSASAVSPSASSSATLSPRHPSASPCPDTIMSEDRLPSTFPVYRPEHSSSDLHSRTRKRHRDNRPDESTVHGISISPSCWQHENFSPASSSKFGSLTRCPNPEITYQKLFAGAQSPTAMAQSITASSVPSRPQAPQRQHSLHRFWSLSSLAPSVPETLIEPPSSTTACQDCEAPLDLYEADTAMGGTEYESDDGAECACRSCGRRVCGTCAVVKVGVGRECLQCRTSTRKKWVGGGEWM